MSDGKKYYCFCSSNCKYETMTKEQILSAIAQAVETGSVGDCDTGFITKVKETNGGSNVTLWVGTQAQYNAIEEKAQNCLYIITDEQKGSDIEKMITQHDERIGALETGAAAMNRVDFFNNASLPYIVGSGGTNLTSCVAYPSEFLYSPALGIVFFSFSVVLEGKMAKNERVKFALVADFQMVPTAHLRACACASGDNNSFAAYCSNGGNRTEFTLIATDSVDTSGQSVAVAVTGWFATK